MPEPILELPSVTAAGSWGGQEVTLSGTLKLDEEGVAIVAVDAGERFLAEYHALSGASWTQGVLTLFKGGDVLNIRGPRELNRVWGLLLQRACEMPEMTRGLRGLGREGGTNAHLQQRFFEPLLVARRALQEPQAPEFRIKRFDSGDMIARLQTTLSGMASQVYPDSAPDRRALEAEFEEYLEPVIESLARLRQFATGVESSPPGERFVAWRAWTSQLRRVFLQADRAWAQMATSLNRTGATS